jgi:hypothetical protein
MRLRLVKEGFDNPDAGPRADIGLHATRFLEEELSMTTPIRGAWANCTAKVLLIGFLVFVSGRLTGVLNAQGMPEESERFEVASIRPSKANDVRPSMQFIPGGGVHATNVTLKLLIQIAYDIRPEQLAGGAGWTDSERYTVSAKGPEGGPPLSAAEQKALTLKRLQALLGERFSLALRVAANPASGYVLTVEKKRHKMTVANDPVAVQLRQVGRWELRAEGIEMSVFAHSSACTYKRQWSTKPGWRDVTIST